MGSKTGLALSAGGARGAYQVGQLKAFVASNWAVVDVLAGASVGALNAVVLASAPSLREGVRRLERMWLHDVPNLRLKPAIEPHNRFWRIVVSGLAKGIPMWRLLKDIGDHGLMSQEDLQELLGKYVDADAMRIGPPVYVSVYRSQGGTTDALRLALAEIGVLDTPESEFVRVNGRSIQEVIERVLASAALPIFFGPRPVGIGQFADGGIGGRRRRQGATPIDPLVEEGCNRAVVSHLDDGSPWTRSAYPELTVVELRPRNAIRRGPIKDLFERRRGELERWQRQGFEDAQHQLQRLSDALTARGELVRAESAVTVSEDVVRAATLSRKAAMSGFVDREDDHDT